MNKVLHLLETYGRGGGLLSNMYQRNIEILITYMVHLMVKKYILLKYSYFIYSKIVECMIDTAIMNIVVVLHCF